MRYFVALAETLHFGRAAARMNMSQPPFSRQIANLERQLGVKLVERNSRHVALTAAGRRFLEDSRAVLARFDGACRDAQFVAEGRKGELRLGFMMHSAHSLMPRLVSLYARHRPEVHVVLVETAPGDAERKLLDKELDAVIAFGGATLPQLRSRPIQTDSLWLIAPPSHPLAAKAMISPQDLEGVDLIAAPAATAPQLRSAILDYCRMGGVIPKFRFEPQLQYTILRLVAAELGAALVPGSIRDEQTQSVVWRPLERAPRWEVVLTVPRDSANPAVEPLIELVAREFSP